MQTAVNRSPHAVISRGEPDAGIIATSLPGVGQADRRAPVLPASEVSSQSHAEMTLELPAHRPALIEICE